MSRLKWLERWKERRQSPRRRVDRLEAVYWTGGAVTPRRVREVSLSGACIEMPEEWYKDTLIRLTLRHAWQGETDDEPGLYIAVWVRVVRKVADGVCVEFVLGGPSEFQSLRRFLEDVERRDEAEAKSLPKAVN
jgi:PilZ domain